jgi:hypothetical protein
VQVTFVVTDNEILVLYLCFGLYRVYQFVAKVKTIGTSTLLDSLPRRDAVTKLCSVKLNIAYCRDPE